MSRPLASFSGERRLTGSLFLSRCPMATVTFEDLTFDGTLAVTRDYSSMGQGRHDRPITKLGGDTNFSVYTTKPKPALGKPAYEELWILSPEMQFDGHIHVRGPANKIREWRAGLIQAITSSERIGYYSGLRVWRLRLDTSFGPLKDGQSGSLFYVSEVVLQVAGNQGTAQVSESDAPNFSLPTQISADLAHPHQALPPDHFEELERTGGADCFISYLAVVHDPSKTIIVLGKCSWQVSWEGRYDFSRKAWCPANESLVNLHYESDFGAVYSHLGENKHVMPPFSLFKAEAEKSCQIATPEGWKACSMSGDLKPNRQRDLARWSD